MGDARQGLFVAGLIAQALVDRIDTFDRENAHLRVVAQKVECPYGHRADNGACMLGYPGCACMDDLICATCFEPATKQERYIERLEIRTRSAETRLRDCEFTAKGLELRNRGLEERVRIAASTFHSMAEGFERNAEPSKAAACEGMADLMEGRL